MTCSVSNAKLITYFMSIILKQRKRKSSISVERKLYIVVDYFDKNKIERNKVAYKSRNILDKNETVLTFDFDFLSH